MTAINDGHTLHLRELQDYGNVEFSIRCPGPTECKATADILEAAGLDIPKNPPPCFLAYWFDDDPDVGRESIQGRAAGPGPWDVIWEVIRDDEINFYVGTAKTEHDE